MSRLTDLQNAKSLADLASILGYKPSGLSYIAYAIPVDQKYKEFAIPKKSGGERRICAPCEQLKSVQRRLANILYACIGEIERKNRSKHLQSISHGFRERHSIITNAKLHKNRRYVLNIDLQDFFPTFNFGRVRGFFIQDSNFKLNDKVATVVAQIACFENALPQGSPCSPVIAELIARILDIRLVRLAKRNRLFYSRYADDLTFSTNQRTFPASIAEPMIPGTLWKVGRDLTNGHLEKCLVDSHRWREWQFAGMSVRK